MTDILAELYATIIDRKRNPKPGSYTNSLFEAGEDEIVKKVGEEAIEVIIAVKGQPDQRVVEETADLLYHLWVLLAWRGVTPDQVKAELEKRHRM
ncbi:phosphoribosyl-ATP pyrophosphohydrolase [Thermoflexales bacterium]|nr:phosphoribosyl-ATP pyrophosphohydrolase [Thermoflexales bacterium]